MAIALPASTHINVVATTLDHTAKTNLGSIRTGSYLSQASMLVYDDILRFQNSTPKVDVIDNLTPTQKKAVYQGIKQIYQPMYGVSGSQYYDETYFNLLKGYVGSYFYKEYDWFNTDQSLNILEFAALNIGNALYQFIDAVATDETITEAYNDYAEQAMGTYRAYQQDNANDAFVVRDELKDKRLKIQLYDDPDSSGNAAAGGIVYAGFDPEGELVVWDSESYPSIGTTADITKFVYNAFEGNTLWFMDELVGIESDWRAKASPGIEGNTAYSYVQFTEDSVDTAVNRYIGHLERFNERSLTRDWEPYTIKRGEILDTPEWLTTLRNSTGTHEEKLDALTYDEMLALAFVHLHGKNSKDSNFVLMAEGNIEASKDLYKNNHHTNPDAATLTRLEKFFPHRKQNKYVEVFICSPSSTNDEYWMKKCCVADNEPVTSTSKTPDDVIDCLKQKLSFKSGDDLLAAMYADPEYIKYTGLGSSLITVDDVTSQVAAADLGAYSSISSNLSNATLVAGSSYKVIKRSVSTKHNYYFYRTGDSVQTQWLEDVKTELTTYAADYNCDELCQTISVWGASGQPTFMVDFFNISSSDANFHTPSGTPMKGFTNGFYANYLVPGGVAVIATRSVEGARTQLRTLFHEIGGHAAHSTLSWGGIHGTGDGDRKFLTNKQNTDMRTVYKNSAGLLQYAALLSSSGLSHPAPAGTAAGDFLDKMYNHYPMSYIQALGQYGIEDHEEEFLARVYAMMALNKCITFTDDIWPVMKAISPQIATIIPLDVAKIIDTEMRDTMKLNKRTYSI